jgi:hypothetical protein
MEAREVQDVDALALGEKGTVKRSELPGLEHNT